MFDKIELRKFPYLLQELNKKRQLSNPVNYSPNILYNLGKLEDILSKKEVERINNVLNEKVYDLTPIEKLFMKMAYLEYAKYYDNFPVEVWRKFHKADLINLFSKTGLYMEFINMDIKTIIYLATYKKLTDDDLRMVQNELIAYLSSCKRNSYYTFILKLASESVLSVCKNRNEFIEFLLKYGIRKTFLAYAKEQFVYMDIAEDFLKEVTKSLIKISKDLSFFEMISIFFATGPYKIEFLKGIKGKICNKDFEYVLIQVITKCYHDKDRLVKILKEKLTYKDLCELYNLLLEVSDDIQSYKELLEMSSGELKEKIQASILLLDIKGA